MNVPSDLTAEQISRRWNWNRCPSKAGLFRQAYRSSEEIPAQALPERYRDERKPFGTAIFYLLTDAAGFVFRVSSPAHR